MKWLARNFLRGILVLVPIALTLYVVFRVFRFMDGHLGPHISGWVGIPIPGVGVVATLVLITLIGVLAANLAARRLFATVERIVARLPFLRTLYTSIRSLVENFAGDNPGFHHPVVVDLTPDGGVRAAGFITNNDLVFLGLAEHVAVYLPQSYNFAGNLLIFPSDGFIRFRRRVWM